MLIKIVKALIAFFLDFIETAVVALSIFVIVYLFLFQPHQVRGNSMLPNYHDSEYVLTNKIDYRFGQPKRLDVIVFKAPQNEDYDYIKRIIALPGDTIEISSGKVILNNKILDETSYLDKDIVTQPGIFLKSDTIYTLGEDEYFVMGDNRSHSSDSREWGPVPRQNIVGHAWLRYWPPSKFGFL